MLNHLRTSIAIKQSLLQQLTEDPSPLINSAELIALAFSKGKKLLICGNGGSAADAQHLATEFMCRLSKERNRKALPAIALTTDTSFLTAYPNDYNFEGIFSRQVSALGQEGDVLLGISTSGNSKNVLEAIKTAKSNKMSVITLTGESGDLIKEASVAIKVPSSNTNIIQESHIVLEHMLCAMVEEILFD